MKKEKKYLTTYLCSYCQHEICDYEEIVLQCNLCGNEELIIVGKEKMSMQAYDNSMRKLNIEIMKLLKENYLNKNFDDDKFNTEEKILKRLASGEKLNKKIESGETMTTEEMNKLMDPLL